MYLTVILLGRTSINLLLVTEGRHVVILKGAHALAHIHHGLLLGG
ncbi:hypothetical protein [Desulforamulus profundi]|nr:hypothetical protein [Desulforamulus profundi]